VSVLRLKEKQEELRTLQPLGEINYKNIDSRSRSFFIIFEQEKRKRKKEYGYPDVSRNNFSKWNIKCYISNSFGYNKRFQAHFTYHFIENYCFTQNHSVENFHQILTRFSEDFHKSIIVT